MFALFFFLCIFVCSCSHFRHLHEVQMASVVVANGENVPLLIVITRAFLLLVNMSGCLEFLKLAMHKHEQSYDLLFTFHLLSLSMFLADIDHFRRQQLSTTI